MTAATDTGAGRHSLRPLDHRRLSVTHQRPPRDRSVSHRRALCYSPCPSDSSLQAIGFPDF